MVKEAAFGVASFLSRLHQRESRIPILSGYCFVLLYFFLATFAPLATFAFNFNSCSFVPMYIGIRGSSLKSFDDTDDHRLDPAGG